MKIAIFSDIHGNIEALKTAYREAQIIRADKIYHLGDVGGYAPFVNEVVDFLVERGIDGVQGNYDYNVANDSEHCGCKYENPEQAAMAQESFEWTKEHASSKSKEFMKNLPQEISFDAYGKRVKLFHAVPHKNNIYWYEDRSEKFFREMAEKADADILVYGHTHKPYTKKIDNIIFINAGSVGKQKDGDPRACLTVLEISLEKTHTHFIRARYDVEKVAAAIVLSGLPSQFAEKLRKGT
jgi:putative phosphoesterase